MAKRGKPEETTSPTGETDELCDRGEDGQQCYGHPAHVGIHIYDPDDERAKRGKLTKK